MTKLSTIEGIGPVLEAKLKQAGVKSCEALLQKGATGQGRETIVQETGIDGNRILRFVNHADLCRIRGIGGEYSELLEAAGVDSVPELAQRNAENLAKKMAEVNAQKKLVRSVPSARRVSTWVAQATTLPKIVTH
jgi:predicted flap endonuclease-1-like 5' DNA nuclease